MQTNLLLRRLLCVTKQYGRYDGSEIVFLFQNELPVCLPIFLERLRNEITRLTTVKALTKIASSPLHIDLRPILVIMFNF